MVQIYKRDELWVTRGRHGPYCIVSHLTRCIVSHVSYNSVTLILSHCIALSQQTRQLFCTDGMFGFVLCVVFPSYEVDRLKNEDTSK